MGITIVSRGFCGFLISSSSFLARLASRVSLYCFLFLLFFYSSLFFPFFFNIVMDVEEREKREREREEISRNVWDDNGGLEFIKGRAQLGVE